MRVVRGFIGMFRVFLPAAVGVVIALAGTVVLPAGSAAAATCPTVDPSTGAVSPAPAPGVDWSGCDLYGADLTGADLTDANLTGANLYLAVITSANFTGATLTGVQSGDVTYQSAPTLPANWLWISGGYLAGPGADLAGASVQASLDLDGVDLAGADLAGANLYDPDIENADLSGTNFDNSTVTEGVMNGDTFTSATFTGADLGGTAVENSNLTGADLEASTFLGTFSGDDLTGADMTGANFSGATLTSDNLTSATFVNANLYFATLTGDNVSGTTLSGASLSQLGSSGLTGTPATLPADWLDQSGFLLGPTAYLVNENLAGANLSNADLSTANLSSTTLTGATLTGANLSGATLNGVLSGSLAGKPASLPANWSVTDGYLLGPAADLQGASLADLSFGGADLEQANLSSANLTGVNFGSADLEQANLQDASLADANLGTADMSEATLTGVTSGGVVPGQGVLPESWFVKDGYIFGPGANLDGADLAGFSLTGDYLFNIQLADADLENTDFSGTNLEGDLSGANLTNANLTGVGLTGADLSGANFSGVSLTGVLSGIINAAPLNLPAPWQLLDGYLLGPGADLGNADLDGAAFDNADLYGAGISYADVTGTTWTDTICPDGTNSDNDGNTCVNNLNAAPITPPVADPSLAGRLGANGWYTSAVTVTWNWTDSVGQIDTADCTTATTITGEGASIPMTAYCASTTGLMGTAEVQVPIDTTAPQVQVTGIGNGKVYPLGDVPVPGCTTTDSVSGVATAAKVTVTGASSHGTGSFAATCAGAVNKAGLAAAPVTVHYSVGYRFGGLAAPKPGSTLPKSTRTITVRFRLAGATGATIPPTWAAALAKAGQVRVAFTGPGISPVTAACAWNSPAGYFQCTLKVPSGIKAGKSSSYAITAQERLGTAFVTVPVAGKTANPAVIHFL
jgi:uncharacterized protein YjbI with pentapeptide repeats